MKKTFRLILAFLLLSGCASLKKERFDIYRCEYCIDSIVLEVPKNLKATSVSAEFCYEDFCSGAIECKLVLFESDKKHK
jgi:hypothetical protein